MSDSFLHHFLDTLHDIIVDPATIEISLNADATVWVEKAGTSFMTMVDVPAANQIWIRDLAQQIANETSQTLSEQSPMVSGTVQYFGVTLRVQGIIPPAAANGTIISIRLFRPRSKDEEPRRFSFLGPPDTSSEDERREKIKRISDLVSTDGDPDTFLRACIMMQLNILVSGGTSTGKTELARRLQWMIPHEERLVVIEDATELLPNQKNSVNLIATRSDASERSPDKLLQATLRLRPDRIILGELRGKEAATFLGAINSGHGGSFTTIHAETARKAFDRLALLVLEVGTQLSFSEVISYLRGSIDLVIQTGREASQRGIVEVWFPALD